MSINLKIASIIIAVALLAPAYGACEQGAAVVDSSGRTVEIPAKVERIVCLGPGCLRLVAYLGLQDKVVGIENMDKSKFEGRPYMLANPELAKLPLVGPGGPGAINKPPDMELVLKIKPQLIFVTYMDKQNADNLQKTLGIHVVTLTYGRFATFDEAVYDSLRIVGKVMNREKRAEDVIAFVESARKDLAVRVASIPDADKPRAYVGCIGHKGAQQIESTDPEYTPLDWTNAINLAKSLGSKDHLFVNKEQILSWNPDVIFLDAGGLHLTRMDFQKKPEFYESLKAYKDKRIFTLYPYNMYVTNIGTAIADAYAAGEIMFPDKFADIDLKTKTNEIYTFLLGKPLYEEMRKDFGELGGVAPFGN